MPTEEQLRVALCLQIADGEAHRQHAPDIDGRHAALQRLQKTHPAVV